jgi:hypothetical protein
MKIIIEIVPDKDNIEKVCYNFKIKGKPESMAVHRANARMSRVIAQAYQEIHAESEYIKKQLESEE